MPAGRLRRARADRAPAADRSAREVQLVDVATQSPSPFARSLLFGYVAAFMYEGDSPLAERRAAALSLDQGLLAELLGRAELRELLDPEVLAEVEPELQRLADDRQGTRRRGAGRPAPAARSAVDRRGPRRGARHPTRSVDWLSTARRRRDASSRSGSPARSAGRSSRTSPGCATGSACRCRRARPDAFTEPVDDPLGDLVARFARTHGPFATADVAARLGLGVAVAQQTLVRLAASGPGAGGRVPARRRRAPSGATPRCCAGSDAGRWPAAPRGRAGRAGHARPLPARLAARGPSTGSTSRGLRGVDGVVTVVEQLAGCAVPASRAGVAGARRPGWSTTHPSMLDELTATGEVLWAGHGALPGTDGWVSLHLADAAPLTLPDPQELDLVAGARLDRSTPSRAAAPTSSASSPTPSGSTDDRAMAAALWDLVWSGRVGNDTLAPLRALVGTGRGRTAHRSRRPPAARAHQPPARPTGDADPHRPAGRPPGAGSCCPTVETDPTRTGARGRPRACSSATASSPAAPS